MIKKILIFFIHSTVFAASQTTYFHIDAATRGAEITSMIATLNSAPYNGAQSEVGLQLISNAAFPYAPYVYGGLIPYVASVNPAPNDTLLLVTYYPSLPKGIGPLYLVVPIEQVTSVVYSPVPIAPGSTFSSNYMNGITPLLTVDPILRAADIENMIATLLAPPFNGGSSSVALYTTLSGPFYPPISGGIIQNVQSVTQIVPNDTLLLVSYLSPTTNMQGTIIVAVEQVLEIVYYPQFYPK